jgi:hypothetical protein
MKKTIIAILIAVSLFTACQDGSGPFEYREILSLGKDLKSGVMTVSIFYDQNDTEDDYSDEYAVDKEKVPDVWTENAVRKEFSRYPKLVLDRCTNTYDEEYDCDRLDLGFHFKLVKDFNNFAKTRKSMNLGPIGLTYNKAKRIYTYRRTITDAPADYTVYSLVVQGNFTVTSSNADVRNGNTLTWEFEPEDFDENGSPIVKWFMTIQFKKK